MSAPRVIAQSPFNDITASIILRSCDNVDFYVYKEILKATSPFFRTMFSLPQPSPTSDQLVDSTASMEDEISPEGLLIIPIPEDSETLDYILRLCYPLRAPARLTLLSLAEKVLTAALKYEMDKVVGLAREDLLELGKSSPMRLYMFSCKHGLENEACTAAGLLRQSHPVQHTEKDFVRIAMEIYSEEYNQLPAIFLYRLLRHMWSGDQQSFSNPSSSTSNREPEGAGTKNRGGDSGGNHESRLPWNLAELLSKHPADILLQSSDGMIIPTHKLILRVSSGDTLLLLAEAGECPQQDGLPLVPLSLTGAVLTQLVQACYFSLNYHEDGHKPEDDLRLAFAAKKYQMHKIATMAKERWVSHLQKDPLNSYFIACLNGWANEACETLRHMAMEGMLASTNCVPTMSIAGTTKHYHAFLQYYNALHGVNDTALQTTGSTRFPRRGQETWNDPSYACSASIVPVVIHRALNSLYTQTTPYNHHYGHRSWRLADQPQAVNIVDPPINAIFSSMPVDFASFPAEYIRAIVQDSQILDEGRKKCIEAIDMTAVVQAASM
ncbi:hypothetical protein QCA50_004235 [Cerrena zonata]|uniref:BTB domain-containing protein n=1 Tax=Cerrena zonata TaxID=2478898 RepID=A0AAW0GGP7_9APHY